MNREGIFYGSVIVGVVVIAVALLSKLIFSGIPIQTALTTDVS